MADAYKGVNSDTFDHKLNLKFYVLKCKFFVEYLHCANFLWCSAIFVPIEAGRRIPSLFRKYVLV